MELVSPHNLVTSTMEKDDITEDIELEEQDDEQEEPEAEEVQEPQPDLEAELKKQRAINARLKKKLEAPQKPKQNEGSEDRLDLMEQMVDLRMEGYSKEEIDFIKQNTPVGTPLKESTENPFVKAAIDGIRAESSTQEAIPEPSAGTVVLDGKTFNEVVSGDSSPEEKQRAFEALKQKRKGNKGIE